MSHQFFAPFLCHTFYFTCSCITPACFLLFKYTNCCSLTFVYHTTLVCLVHVSHPLILHGHVYTRPKLPVLLSQSVQFFLSPFFGNPTSFSPHVYMPITLPHLRWPPVHILSHNYSITEAEPGPLLSQLFGLNSFKHH